MIRISHRIVIDEREIEESFVRASGSGGQNVNKLTTAVQLRFDVRRSPGLPDIVRERLERLAGQRMTHEGVLILDARRHRTQERNRKEALARLIDLVRRAATPPVPRRLTKPTAAARRRRLHAKRHRAAIKSLRAAPPPDDQ